MEVYRCVHPQCTHFTRRILIIGKEILCHKCHLPTLARNEQLHAGHSQIGTKVLTCVKCSNSPKRFAIQAVEDVLTSVLNEVNEEENRIA